MGTAGRLKAVAGAGVRRAAKGGLALQVTSLLAGALLWEVVGHFGHVSWLPALHTVLGRVGALWAAGELQGPLVDSLTNLTLGYAVSVVAGVAIGSAMALSKKVDYALRVYVDALMAAPSIMFAPVFFIIFGLSRATLLAVIILYACVFIVSSTRTAIAGASTNLQDMARSFGATRTQIFGVMVREAAPALMAGVRIGMGRAVKGMFNGELFVAVVGLAALEKRFEGSFDAAGILAVALVIIALAVLLASLLSLVNRALNSWVPR